MPLATREGKFDVIRLHHSYNMLARQYSFGMHLRGKTIINRFLTLSGRYATRWRRLSGEPFMVDEESALTIAIVTPHPSFATQNPPSQKRAESSFLGFARSKTDEVAISNFKKLSGLRCSLSVEQ